MRNGITIIITKNQSLWVRKMLGGIIHFPFYQFLPLPFHFFHIEQLLFIFILVMMFICNVVKEEHFEIIFKSISLSNVGEKLEGNGFKEHGRESIYFFICKSEI